MQATGTPKDGAEPRAHSTQVVEQLYTLAKSGDRNVRKILATDRATPGEILSLLSEDPEPNVRVLVAKNPSTPHHSVAKLAHDSSPMVRMGLASDAQCPVEILCLLAEDDDENVRLAAKATRRMLLATYPQFFNNVAFS